MRPHPSPHTIQMPPLDLRAAVAVADEAARTVELTFSTGAGVERYDWATGERYIEKLSMEAAHVRLGRLNAGAPLLNSHGVYSLTNVLGVVEDGSASVDGKKGRATVRFSKRADVDPIFQDVRDKVIRNVSVGYFTYAVEKLPAKGSALPVRLAVDWEPYEISLVSVGADAGARVRSGDTSGLNACVIVARGAAVNDADRLRLIRLAKARH